MAKIGGIIDSRRNPFATRNDWKLQGFGLTPTRRNDAVKILGKSFQEIWQIVINKGRYVAFVAIRWGFAEMKGDRLTAKHNWHDLHGYDYYGENLGQ